jgi:hypothetical protein
MKKPEAAGATSGYWRLSDHQSRWRAINIEEQEDAVLHHK